MPYGRPIRGRFPPLQPGTDYGAPVQQMPFEHVLTPEQEQEMMLQRMPHQPSPGQHWKDWAREKKGQPASLHPVVRALLGR